jgi:hypothetical protein
MVNGPMVKWRSDAPAAKRCRYFPRDHLAQIIHGFLETTASFMR